MKHFTQNPTGAPPSRPCEEIIYLELRIIKAVQVPDHTQYFQ